MTEKKFQQIRQSGCRKRIKQGREMGRKMEKKYEIMQKAMDALEEILCSYPGRGHKSAYTDIDSLAFLARLVAGSQIYVENYSYDYDDEIHNDETAVRIYRQFAPQTRWRTGCHTQIERIRMNALKQFAAMGTPVYQGNIYYADTGSDAGISFHMKSSSFFQICRK